MKQISHNLKRLSLIFIFAFTLSNIFTVSLLSKTVSAAAARPANIISQCTNGFLGLEPWYYFLPKEDFAGSSAISDPNTNPCDLKCFNVLDQGDFRHKNDCGRTKSDLPLVALAIIDDLLRITGLVALGFIIYGAFQFVGSQGNPEATARARNTIVNALLGMAVAIIAVAVVSFIGNKFGA